MNEKIDRRVYFSTGEFARLCGVSKHTLFHYDSISLFSPELRLDNDYRLYGCWQLDTFAVIEILKQLNMSLGEIKEYFAQRSPENLLSLLQMKEQEIREQMERLEEMQSLVKEKISDTQKALSLRPGVVFREEQPQKYFAYSLVDENGAFGLALTMKKHAQLRSRFHIPSSCTVSGLYRMDNVHKGEYDRYHLLCSEVEAPDEEMDILVKPAGLYLIICCLGDNTSVEVACAQLKDYAKEHHLTLDEYIYEDLLLDELSIPGGFDQFLLQLSIRILA